MHSRIFPLCKALPWINKLSEMENKFGFAFKSENEFICSMYINFNWPDQLQADKSNPC